MILPANTPANNPFNLPNIVLQNAIEEEWKNLKKTGKKYTQTAMPLTAIAYTAIDKIAGKKSDIIEVLMVYIESDSLTYRASSSEKLSKEQDEKWGEILRWAGSRFDVSWAVTSGVMPIEQSPHLHKTIERYLLSLSEFQLAAFCVLSSLFSSLVLAIAVCEGHLSAQSAFELSRLEEEFSAQEWGRDKEADSRADNMKKEAISAGEFLELLR